MLLNPEHASSHNAIARLSYIENRRIPALLAYCRFLAIEPQSERAKDNLANIQKIMKANVKQKDNKTITISISPESLADTTAGGKRNENSFGSVELVLGMETALDYDEKNAKQTDIEMFLRKLETVCSLMAETKKDNYGFFWDYYVPYFTEMKEKKLLELFAHIAFASSDDSDNSTWLKEHASEIDRFFDWSKAYKWETI